MKVFIETERLILRELSPSDVDGIFELDSDAKVHQYLGNNPIASKKEASETIAFIRDQYDRLGIGRWAVVEKNNQNFIGWAGFKRITEETNSHCNYLDLGYRLIQSRWGRGYASEIANALVDYAFTELREKEIFSIADVENLASNKVLEKVGFLFIEEFEYQNKPHNWYQMLGCSSP